ncbi:MAG TPA: PepSY domain-containing protein [Caulobacteraceae bacterium]|nr:PepSY domain-containing protein [Caulobacteraceae bacterium]
MKRMFIILAAVAAAALATPASAQWRDNGRHDRGVPQEHDSRGPPPQPTHGPPPPVGRGPPPNPGLGADSLGAGWRAQQDEVRQGVTQRRYVPLGQAIESIRRLGAGRELDAGLEDWAGRPAYRVRWAEPNGQRVDYIVDAESGAILGVDRGR